MKTADPKMTVEVLGRCSLCGDDVLLRRWIDPDGKIYRAVYCEKCQSVPGTDQRRVIQMRRCVSARDEGEVEELLEQLGIEPVSTNEAEANETEEA